MKRLKASFSSNACLKEYEMGKQVASAGSNLLWKVYEGFNRARKEHVSLFVFEKKTLMADKSVGKPLKEKLIDMARTGAQQLQKLRHPGVLKIVFPVAESKDFLAFAAEPCIASLANLLGNYSNLTPVSFIIKEYELDEMEVSIGITQVSEALAFLHDHAGMAHGNITPTSVVVTKEGAWKLFAFDFAAHLSYQGPDNEVAFPEFSVQNAQHSSVAKALQPSLDFLAPEVVLTKTREAGSDVYALAQLIFACFNNGHPLLSSDDNVLAFESNVEKISRFQPSDYAHVPQPLQLLMKELLANPASLRPAASDIKKHSAFNTTPMLALRFVTSLHEKDSPTKAEFMKGFVNILPSFPQRVLRQRVLPSLLTECKTLLMAPFVLPIVFKIAESLSILEFETMISPHLIPLYSAVDPIQIMYIMVKNLPLLLEKSPKKVVTEHILPMMLASLGKIDKGLTCAALAVLPAVMMQIDFAILKAKFLPRIKALAVGATTADLAINAIVCLGKLLPMMDKWMFAEDVLPTLGAIKLREAGVVMALVGVIHEAMKEKAKYGLEMDMIATQILVFLAPLLVTRSLNSKQFQSVMKLFADATKCVDDERGKQLREKDRLKSIAATTTGVSHASKTASSSAPDTDADQSLLRRMMQQQQQHAEVGSVATTVTPRRAQTSVTQASSSTHRSVFDVDASPPSNSNSNNSDGLLSSTSTDGVFPESKQSTSLQQSQPLAVTPTMPTTAATTINPATPDMFSGLMMHPTTPPQTSTSVDWGTTDSAKPTPPLASTPSVFGTSSSPSSSSLSAATQQGSDDLFAGIFSTSNNSSNSNNGNGNNSGNNGNNLIDLL